MRRAYPQTTPLATGKRPHQLPLTPSCKPHNLHDLSYSAGIQRETTTGLLNFIAVRLTFAACPGFPS
jgi:hypothetical protein